ncbi:MAG TPA: nucleotidyltransferase domain-containing protein [Phycisphaerae bacterium]|nr:nucleotidyltransferase domain-containing protein [Phycisphaerae bacterium]
MQPGAIANPFSDVSPADLADAVNRLVAELKPRAIYLFGSHAQGMPRSDSDVDLMIVVDKPLDTVESLQGAYACIRGVPLRLEMHFCTRERFERFAPVFGTLQNDVLRKGVLLYAA